jgi:hypothetical protein
VDSIDNLYSQLIAGFVAFTCEIATARDDERS